MKADSLWLNPAFEQEEWRKIVETPLKSKSYRYSCINFILLKEIVEQISGEGMDCLLEREFFEPMGLNHLLYLPLRRYPKERIVPTVRNDYLRRACPVLQGYVHDEAAAFFGGISGNAGLFGTAADVAAVCQMLLDGGMYHGRRYLSEATCQLFAASTSSISRRGLGFDRPDPDNHVHGLTLRTIWFMCFCATALTLMCGTTNCRGWTSAPASKRFSMRPCCECRVCRLCFGG